MARRDLPADVRPGQHGDASLVGHLAPYLTHAPAVLGQTLRRRKEMVHGPEQGTHAFAEREHSDARGSDDDVFRRVERTFEIGGDGDAIGDADAWEVPAVLAFLSERARVLWSSGPEHHVASAIAREDRRERRAPRPRLQDRDRGQAPSRGSTPRAIRWMFGTCRTYTMEPATRMNA